MRTIKCISRLMTLYGFGSRLRSFFFVRVASLLLLSLFSFGAQAADYIWSTAYGTYSSASGACQDAAVKWQANNNPQATVQIVPVADTLFNCIVTGHAGFFSGASETIGANRSGDSCATGTIYNTSQGSCDAPSNKCAALKDTPVPSFRFQSTTDAPTGTISKNGCGITLGTGICVTRTAPLYDCTFSGVITGLELDDKPGQSTSDCTGAQCSDNQPQKEVKDDPCSAIPAGSGFTCTATKSEDNPGKSQCGTANGAYVCVDNPKPTSNVSKSDISQTVTSNADGSTSTKTTTTTTTTNCQGIGNCSTGTTTTVVTGGTNPNGTNKPPSSTCTGPECGGGHVGGGNGNGNGSSGEGDDEDPGDDDSVSGDMVCTALVACSGDVIQCAILRQEQQARCADADFRDLSDKKVADAKLSLDGEFAGSDYKEIKADGDHTFDVSNMIDTSGFLGSSCPALPTINGSWRDFPVHIDFNLQSFCTFLTILGYINVAFALRKAAVIVGEGAV